MNGDLLIDNCDDPSCNPGSCVIIPSNFFPVSVTIFSFFRNFIIDWITMVLGHVFALIHNLVTWIAVTGQVWIAVVHQFVRVDLEVVENTSVDDRTLSMVINRRLDLSSHQVLELLQVEESNVTCNLSKPKAA